MPTSGPTWEPTAHPTALPSAAPIRMPTSSPEMLQTDPPVSAPSVTPTAAPSRAPSIAPTRHPSMLPTNRPTQNPTAVPTQSPTARPTEQPSQTPTTVPTTTPSRTPTATPTAAPTAAPTDAPTLPPTALPSLSPSAVPSSSPTTAASACDDPVAEPRTRKDCRSAGVWAGATHVPLMSNGPATGADEDANVIRTLNARGIVIGEATICALGQATRDANLSAYVQRWSLVVDAPSDDAVLQGKRSAWLVAELRNASDYNVASRIANGVSATDVGDMLVQHASAINSDPETPSVRSLLMDQVTSGALADIAGDAAAIVRDAVDDVLGPVMDFSGLNVRLAQGVSDTVTVSFTVPGNLPAPDLDALASCEAAGDDGLEGDDGSPGEEDAGGAADSVMARLMLSAATDAMFAAGETSELDRRRRQEPQPTGPLTPAPTSAPNPEWCPKEDDEDTTLEEKILDRTLEMIKTKSFEYEIDQGGCTACAVAADGNSTAGPCKQTDGPGIDRCFEFAVDTTDCNVAVGHRKCPSPAALSPQIAFKWTLPGSFYFTFTWKVGWLWPGAGEFVFYARINMDPHMGYAEGSGFANRIDFTGDSGFTAVKKNLGMHGYGRFVDKAKAPYFKALGAGAGIGYAANGTAGLADGAAIVTAGKSLGVFSPAYFKALMTAYARNFKYTFVRPGAPVADLEFSAKYTETGVDRDGRADLSAEIHLTLNNVFGATSAPCHSFCDGMYYIYDWLNVATGSKHKDPTSYDPAVLWGNARNPWPLILTRDFRWGGLAPGIPGNERIAEQQLRRQYGVACPTDRTAHQAGDGGDGIHCDRVSPRRDTNTPNLAQSTGLATQFGESSYAVPGFKDRLESGLNTWNFGDAASKWLVFLRGSSDLKALAYGSPSFWATYVPDPCEGKSTTYRISNGLQASECTDDFGCELTRRGGEQECRSVGGATLPHPAQWTAPAAFQYQLVGPALELALCMRGRTSRLNNKVSRVYCAKEIESVRAAGPIEHREDGSYMAYIKGMGNGHAARSVMRAVGAFWQAAQRVHQRSMVEASDKAQMLACLWFSRKNLRPYNLGQRQGFSGKKAARPTLPARLTVFEAPALRNLRTAGIGEFTYRTGPDSECSADRGGSAATGSAGYPLRFDLRLINQNAWDRTEPEWENFGCGDDFTGTYPFVVNGPGGRIPAAGPQLCADGNGVGLRKAWLNSIPRTDRRTSAWDPGSGRWAFKHCFAGEDGMPWSGVPKAEVGLLPGLRIPVPKMRWLPLLDTLFRMGQFNGKQLELKSLLMDYPDRGTTFKQRDDEYIGRPAEVRSWPNSQDFDGVSALEQHWMHQKMWLRSALVTKGRAPTFQKRVNMDVFRPQTSAFTNYWTGSGTTGAGAKAALQDELKESLQKTSGTAVQNEEGNRWDLSLRMKVGLSLKSMICTLMS